MNDAVNQIIANRERVETSFVTGLVSSFVIHGFALAALVAASFLPAPPVLKIQTGVLIPLPPGGGSSGASVESAPAPTPSNEANPPPPAPAPPKVIKPPDETANSRKGLPDPLSGKNRKTPPRAGASVNTGATDKRNAAGGGTTGLPGLQFGPAGPGVPGGTDPNGDWYLAGVQRKIWMVWMQQIKPPAKEAAMVAFTIQADGTVTDVRLTQSSGVSLVDFAAQRAIASSAPFAPLPRDYGTNRFTIQAVFKTVQ